MRFNGIDPTSLHRAISIAKEIPPGMPKREIITVRGNRGETLSGYQIERDEYLVRMNIAGRTPEESWRVREIIAAWACAGGIKQTARLEPTHRTGVYYEAIAASIDPPEFRPRFATVDVVFILPHPYARDIAQSRASGQGDALAMMIGGTAETRPAITQTMSADTDGLTLEMDGKVFARINGGFSAGQTVEIDFETGSVTIDGTHAEERIDYNAFRWRPGFSPGRHEITSTDAGAMEMRWRNEWM